MTKPWKMRLVFYDEYCNPKLNMIIKEITQEDAWIVIDCYFEENGLVKQQIDSFDEFISTTIGELIEDAGEIICTPGMFDYFGFPISCV